MEQEKTSDALYLWLINRRKYYLSEMNATIGKAENIRNKAEAFAEAIQAMEKADPDIEKRNR